MKSVVTKFDAVFACRGECVLWLWLLAALAACDTGTQWSLRDTERTIYRASCRDGTCKLEVTSPAGTRSTGCASQEHPGLILAGAGVVSVCHACVPNVHDNSERVRQSLHPELRRCRPLACAHVRDCPPWNRGQTVQCLNGLCVEANMRPERPLDLVSASALCMAGAGPATGEQLPLTADRLAFARASCNLAGQCTQPVGCRSYRSP